jgi:hypothetical protein
MKTINATKANPKVYDPVWRCIYCGCSDEHLQKEHIIPIGLQDGFVLRKSSCETCRRITASIENTVMRKALLPYRWHSGFVTHRDQMPEEIPLGISFDQNPTPRHVALAEHPNCLLLPRLRQEPSMLSGIPQTPFPPAVILLSLDDKIDASMQQSNGKLTLMRHMFNFDPYWRMIAKIAHAFAVADIGLGLDGFIPILPDLILGKNLGLASDLIGDWPGEMPFNQDDDGPLHQLTWGFRPWKDQQLVMVYIRLFSGHGRTPTYAVIVGVATEAAVDRHGLP